MRRAAVHVEKRMSERGPRCEGTGLRGGEGGDGEEKVEEGGNGIRETVRGTCS